MKKLLLSLLCVLSIAISASAGQMEFTFSSGTAESSISTVTSLKSYISSDNASLISAISNVSNLYSSNTTGNGIRLGKSNVAGKVTITFASSYKITTVVVEAKRYNSSKAATLKVNSLATQNVQSSYTSLTYTVNSSSEENSISLESSKYIYIDKITVNYTDGGGSSTTTLGDIMYNGSAVPSTLTVAGETALTFTSENAASMSVYQGTTLEASAGEGSVTWTAPAAQTTDQTYNLTINSLLESDTKTANIAVTVTGTGSTPTTGTAFTKVTSASQLVDGAKYVIITNPTTSGSVSYGPAVMSTAKSTKKGFDAYELNTTDTSLASTYTFDETETSATVLTLVNNGDGTYYFTSGTKYLGATVVKELKLLDSACAFSITPDTDKTTMTISQDLGSIGFTVTNASGGKKGTYTVNSYGSTSTSKNVTLYLDESSVTTTMKWNPASITLSYGETGFTAPALLYEGNGTISYTSSNEQVATVAADGTVTINTNVIGEATLTATATATDSTNGKSVTCVVNVVKADPVMTFAESSIDLFEGEKGTNALTITPSNLTVTYSSSKTDVATVDATTGEVTGIKAESSSSKGWSIISAAFAGNDYYNAKTVEYTVYVIEKSKTPPAISWSADKVTMTIGDNSALPTLTVSDGATVKYDIAYAVDGYAPVTISDTGAITVLTPGYVILGAQVEADDNYYASEQVTCELTVRSISEAENPSTGTGSTSGVGTTFAKVSDTSTEFAAGNEFIILSTNGTNLYGMTDTELTGNDGLSAMTLEAATALPDSYTLTQTSSSLTRFTIDPDTWVLKSGDKFVGGTDERHLKLNDESSDNFAVVYNAYAYGDNAYIKINDYGIYSNPSQGYFNNFSTSNSYIGTSLFTAAMYVSVGTAGAAGVISPIIEVAGYNSFGDDDWTSEVSYNTASKRWEWYADSDDYELTLINGNGAASDTKIYYRVVSAARTASHPTAYTEFSSSNAIKMSDLENNDIQFYAVSNGQQSAVETLARSVYTAVEGIEAEGAAGATRYYNLQGVEVKTPQKGNIYIRLNGPKATKVTL